MNGKKLKPVASSNNHCNNYLMVKAIFIQNRNSKYDDQPGLSYHFPKNYLSRVQQVVGNWIILYESSKNGGSGRYFAIQKIQKIIPDPNQIGHYYAIYEQGDSSRWDFVNPVPLKENNGAYFEGTSPPWQSAVRIIEDDVFFKIFDRGMKSNDDGFSIQRNDGSQPSRGFEEAGANFDHSPRENILVSRKHRDPKFREAVIRAYNGRCAFTGLELRNGGGRAEVEAAHIKPVEKNGPDSIQNGIALTGTVHWMFDRGLISVSEDNQTILCSNSHLGNQPITNLINPKKCIILPDNPANHPHPKFLTWHRENVFHG